MTIDTTTPGPCIGCGRLCQSEGALGKGILRSQVKYDKICLVCYRSRRQQRLGVGNLTKRSANVEASLGMKKYAHEPEMLVEDVLWLLESGEIASQVAVRLDFSDADDLFDALSSVGRLDLVKRFRKLGIVNDI